MRGCMGLWVRGLTSRGVYGCPGTDEVGLGVDTGWWDWVVGLGCGTGKRDWVVTGTWA